MFDKNTETYFSEIGTYSPLTRDEEYTLWKQYKENNNIDARNKLVSANLKFVASIAKRYQGMGLSYNELVAEGNVGLIRAIDKFDGDKGYKLISYSVWWIKQAILEAINKRNVLEADDLPFVVVKEDTENEETTIDDSLSEKYIEDESKIEQINDEKTTVGFLMNFLSDKEKNIINKYYGLDGAKPKTLEEIGSELGITKERVRQIKKNSMLKLRSEAFALQTPFGK